MVDTRNEYFLAAAEIEEDIRRRLVSWLSADTDESVSGLIEQIREIFIPKLHAINNAGYGADQGIAHTLNVLNMAIHANDPIGSWIAFRRLTSNKVPNFGTWIR